MGNWDKISSLDKDIMYHKLGTNERGETWASSRSRGHQFGGIPDTYEIQPGDTFWELELQWKLPCGTLKERNPNLNPKRLQIGTVINVTNASEPQLSNHNPPSDTFVEDQENLLDVDIEDKFLKDLETYINQGIMQIDGQPGPWNQQAFDSYVNSHLFMLVEKLNQNLPSKEGFFSAAGYIINYSNALHAGATTTNAVSKVVTYMDASKGVLLQIGGSFTAQATDTPAMIAEKALEVGGKNLRMVRYVKIFRIAGSAANLSGIGLSGLQYVYDDTYGQGMPFDDPSTNKNVELTIDLAYGVAGFFFPYGTAASLAYFIGKPTDRTKWNGPRDISRRNSRYNSKKSLRGRGRSYGM